MNDGVPSGAYRSPVKRNLPLLDVLHVAAPCRISWDRMGGNGRVRRCGTCTRQVFNISGLGRADAEALLRDHVEGTCERYYGREDGTVLTADCPVGVRRRFGLKALTTLATSAFLAGAGLLVIGSTEEGRSALLPWVLGFPDPSFYAQAPPDPRSPFARPPPPRIDRFGQRLDGWEQVDNRSRHAGKRGLPRTY